MIRNNIKGRTITLKYKTSNFTNHTRSRTLTYYTNSYSDIYSNCKELLEEENIEVEIRLIGVTISSFKEDKIEQLSLF